VTGDIDKIKEVINKKIDTLSRIETILNEGMSRNRDVSWGVSLVKEVGEHFARLRSLDSRNNEIEWFKTAGEDKGILALVDKLQGSMARVKKLMAVLTMRIRGGQEIVKGELKGLVNARKISGYKTTIIKQG